MNIKVIQKEELKKLTIKDLRVGDVFREKCGSYYWVKVNNVANNVNAVSLHNGRCGLFYNQELVKCSKAELTIYE